MLGSARFFRISAGTLTAVGLVMAFAVAPVSLAYAADASGAPAGVTAAATRATLGEALKQLAPKGARFSYDADVDAAALVEVPVAAKDNSSLERQFISFLEANGLTAQVKGGEFRIKRDGLAPLLEVPEPDAASTGGMALGSSVIMGMPVVAPGEKRTLSSSATTLLAPVPPVPEVPQASAQTAELSPLTVVDEPAAPADLATASHSVARILVAQADTPSEPSPGKPGVSAPVLPTPVATVPTPEVARSAAAQVVPSVQASSSDEEVVLASSSQPKSPSRVASPVAVDAAKGAVQAAPSSDVAQAQPVMPTADRYMSRLSTGTLSPAEPAAATRAASPELEAMVSRETAKPVEAASATPDKPAIASEPTHILVPPTLAPAQQENVEAPAIAQVAGDDAPKAVLMPPGSAPVMSAPVVTASEARRAASAKAQAERQAAVKAEAERQAAVRAEAERQAAVKAEAERQAAVKAEAERQAAVKAEAERQAAVRAEAERQAAVKAEAERQAAVKAEAERQAAVKAEAERQAAVKAEAERQAAVKAEAERQAAIAALTPTKPPVDIPAVSAPVEAVAVPAQAVTPSAAPVETVVAQASQADAKASESPAPEAVPATAEQSAAQANDKAEMAGLTGVASEPVAPTPSGSSAWVAERGQTLKAVLDSWCAKANVQLVWSTDYDYPLAASISLNENFEVAVRTLLTGFSGVSPQPVGRLHRQGNAGQRVLLIETRGNLYQEQ